MRVLVGAWWGVALAVGPAAAQLGELQVGVVGAYGSAHAFGPGAGLVLGVAPGRLAYTGVRWTYYFGVPEQRGFGGTDVRTKTQVIVVDLGVQIPMRAVEVYPAVSVGWSQFRQHAKQPDESGNSKEFFAAPGVAVEIRLGRLGIIPEVAYVFAGSPDLPWPVAHQGLVTSVRIVVLKELHRIRR